MKILWKEIRQQRLLVMLGLIIGLIWPIIDLINGRYRTQTYTDFGSLAVLVGGAFFAIILGTYSCFDDLRDGRDNFWRSKPVSPTRLILVKYFVGLISLLLVFLIVQSVDLVTTFHHERTYYFPFCWSVLTWTFPVAGMFFALAIFLTVLLREPARAVFIAVWFGLIFYFGPLLIDRLYSISVFSEIENHQWGFSQLLFSEFYRMQPLSWDLNRVRLMSGWPGIFRLTAVPVLFTVPALVLSIVGIRRNWQWRPGLPTIVWTIGLSLAGIFTIGLIQVGHNLLPLTTYQGKPFNPTINFYDAPEKTFDWLDPKTAGPMLPPPPRWATIPSRQFIKGNLMARVSIIAEKEAGDSAPGRYDWWIDLYQFPAAGKPARHLSRTRFFSTPAIPATWRQYIAASFVKDTKLFVAYQPNLPSPKKNPPKNDLGICTFRFLVADIADPGKPKLIGDREFLRPELFGTQPEMGSAAYGNYCYIGREQDLLVISVAQPGNPRIVKQIPFYSEFKLPPKTLPNREFHLVDNKLVCSSYNCVLILDLKNPESPQKIFFQNMEDQTTNREGIDAVAVSGEFLYLARESGLTVYQLKADSAGLLSADRIGGRPATPLEHLAGRRPHQLLIDQARLFEAAGGFGVLVYDITKPAAPKRIFHGGDEMDIVTTLGLWNGLFYIANPNSPWIGRLTFLKIPDQK